MENSQSELDNLVDRKEVKEDEGSPDERILLDLKSVMSTVAGQNFLAYLLESTDYGRMPQLQFIAGQSDEERQKVYWESVGFNRVGQGMFELMNEADTMLAIKIFEKLQLMRREDVRTRRNAIGGTSQPGDSGA